MADSAAEGLEILVDHTEFEDSDDEHDKPLRSAREKHSTEKMSEYLRNLRLQAFKAAKRSWRKQINSIHSILVARKDITALTAGCEDLERKMTQLSLSHEALEAVTEDEAERNRLYEEFEVVSRENNEALRMISERLNFLQQEHDSKSSMISQSTKTSKISNKSSRKSSRSSSRYSSLSLQQKRVQLEGDIASLRATMALAKERQEKEIEHRAKMDEVQRKKMEIAREEERAKEELKALEENFRIKQELVKKEAQMIASIKHEEQDHHIFRDEFPVSPPTETDSKALLEKFLDDQSASVSNVKVSESGQLPFIPAPWTPICKPKESITESGKPTFSSLNPCTPLTEPIYTSARTPHVNPFSEVSRMTYPSLANMEKDEYGYPLQRDRNSESQIQSKLIEVAKLLAETQSQSRLPLPEPGIFDGDLLQYPVWLKAFETLIEGRAVRPSERLHFLGNYVKGEAKEVVDSFLLLDSEDAYDKAKEMLKKRFGDPFAVAAACRKKLESWPKIHPNDNTALRKYSDFLVQCQKLMEKIGSLRVLNDDHENRKLVSKLPKWASNRWSRFAFNWKEENKVFPPFAEFVKFVVKEADIVCDPVLSCPPPNEEDSGRTMSERNKDKKPRFPRRPHNANAFTTSSNEKKNGTAESRPPLTVKSCFYCKKPHDLDTCPEFVKMTIRERKEFASAKGLCFGCLQHGHLSKDCKERKTCRVCKRQHPTPFHGDYRRREETTCDKGDPNQMTNSAACFMNGQSKSQANSMIVPVWLSHGSNPGTERLVYALLDDQSDTTFIADTVLNHLGVSGPETNLLLSTMHATDELIKSRKIGGLIVQDFKRQVTLPLPKAFSRKTIPAKRSHIPRPESALQWPHLEKIAAQIAPYQYDVEIGILIGSDCPRAIMPREIIPGEDDSPYALRSDLGWGIVGRISQPLSREDGEEDEIGVSHRVYTIEAREPLDPQVGAEGLNKRSCNFSVKTNVKEVINPFQVMKMFEMDFSEKRTDRQATLSQEDLQFLKKMEEGIRQTADGHYEMPLPFQGNTPKLPDNKSLALRRLNKLKTRMENDMKYRQDYMAFMQDIIEKGFAERVPHEQRPDDDGKLWYIPHHGVYHPQKPDKIRIVFDCSATFMGHSLNKYLLQGPDLTNSLVGVLCRFRKELIAFMCDLEAMFHQFKVKEEDRDYLRFYWWENGDITKTPVQYRMTVHLFGAASSPGCANFGLKKTAIDNECEFGSDAANFIRKDFYVDDGLKSVATVSEAASLIENTKSICAKGGMRLHKFISNSKEVIAKIAPEDRAKGVKDLDLHSDVLPIERALGVQWCVESDTFQFRIVLQDKPLTRRGILSTVSSVYDPLGFLAPVILTGRRILQGLCRDKSDWDDPVPEPYRHSWVRWRSKLHHLENLKIQRCYKPHTFGKLTSVQLHHFSDASDHGYGQCSYLRLTDGIGQVHCSFVMGKARVTPLKPVTIPRLELTAALLSIRISASLREELEYDQITEAFYTDSQVVLSYIKNEARRFHVFVANRVQQIRDNSTPDQWKYIQSNENPADEASRGLSPQDLVDSRWLNGPPFLWQRELPNRNDDVSLDISLDDPEVKKVQVFVTGARHERIATISERLEYFSDWHRAKRAVATCMKFKASLQQSPKKPLQGAKKTSQEKDTSTYRSPSVDEMQKAEQAILKSLQEESFPEEIKILKSLGVQNDNASREFAKKRNLSMKRTSSLYRLDPFLDKDGVLRVGGRIRNALVSYEIKHPVILPSKGHVTTLLVRYHHERIRHQGRGMTLNDLRSHGYWVIGGSSSVSRCISKCVICQKLRGALQEQKMANLPEDRLEPAPPFTHCGVDYFGPWLIKEGRKELKRYGVLFTCLSSRAIHLEVSATLETDSFMNALRRFINRRGPIRTIRCDQGSNLVGAKNELQKALSSMDQTRVRHFLLERNCDWFEFQLNVPSASHMGGVWERQIRTARNVLSVLLDQCGSQLNDESLQTFMTEVEAVVNSRPLTVENLTSPDALEPLTPNHLLTGKSRVVLPPPGEFQRADLYLRKRWRRVQHLTNEFWTRWKREFLHTLQLRQKWMSPRRNLQQGDVVIISNDNLPRNMWQIARVEEAYGDPDGYVRKVKLAVGDASLDDKGRRVKHISYLERPVQKLVLLVPSDDGEDSNRGVPTKEP